MHKRLGCLAPQGLIAVGLTLVLVVLVLVLWGGSLFSPGPLNAQEGAETRGGVRSHAETAGRCSACHPAPWSGETVSDRCLVCHVEVQVQLADPASLHGALASDDSVQPCYSCHGEHQGAEAPLTQVDPSGFPHQVTGFSLEGHGQTAGGGEFSCADCHGQDLTSFDPRVCDECHRERDAAFAQAHLGAFGPDCLPCHDGIDRYGAAFDHAQLAFPLEGAHAATDCAGCHPGARSPADLQAAPLDCYACHQEDDTHKGALGQDCAACHTSQAWEEATFDHGQSAFPLDGAHRDVACGDCHQDAIFAGTPTDCYACHQEDDIHEGRLGQDCAACHTSQAWEEVTFDHGQSAFPLDGAHREVDCRDCHQDAVFAGTPADCIGCHEEPAYHAGLFDRDCAACHNPAAWSPAEFVQAHRFPFDHGEAGVSPCAACHPDRLAAYTCYECHEHDPAEIASEHREEGIADFEECVECHPTGLEDEAEDRGRGDGDDD